MLMISKETFKEIKGSLASASRHYILEWRVILILLKTMRKIMSNAKKSEKSLCKSFINKKTIFKTIELNRNKKLNH